MSKQQAPCSPWKDSEGLRHQCGEQLKEEHGEYCRCPCTALKITEEEEST